MEGVPGLVDGMSAILVEFLVVLFRDVVFRLQPNRLNRIDPLAIDLEWKRNESGVLRDDSFQDVLLREILLVLLQVNHDASAPLFFFNL